MAEALQQEAVELLQQLLRINTVNPPGNERPAQEHLAGLKPGAKNIESTVQRKNGAWVALEVERSGGGGEHGGDDDDRRGGDDD